MPRPWITCHVLDTITGRPAEGITVTLRLLSPAQSKDSYFFALTNADGRVTDWTPRKSGEELPDLVDNIKSGDEETSVWSLVFEVEEYFGKGKCFYPEVEIKFSAKKTEEHYHVPLLLGPWGGYEGVETRGSSEGWKQVAERRSTFTPEIRILRWTRNGVRFWLVPSDPSSQSS
ncbi:hypothetical protein B0A48_15810 [Cryoendolithus antarcticus]|uniref:hydroxyisourate hydrolase n=1 Tax=Cryoendolithus antarcticus TaxID=1507870 RepID=A0A1V8SHD3_9PEZI|nr:hypothetical protein B0A48_15810 [Cryoendolithus antarcticus]